MSILKQVQSRRALSEGLRKIGELHTDSGDHHATIHKDHEYGEYRVKFHSHGVHNPDADYHTDDKDDAHGTAEAGLKHLDATKKTVHEEVEPIEEVSNRTLVGYIHAATNKLDHHSYETGKHDGGVSHGANLDRKSVKAADNNQRKSQNRKKGIHRATSKLADRMEELETMTDEQLTEEHFEFILDNMTIEEFEQLDEISKQTVSSYYFKVKDKIAHHDSEHRKHADHAARLEKGGSDGSWKAYQHHSDEAARHSQKAAVHSDGKSKARKRLSEVIEAVVKAGGRPKKPRTLDGKIAPNA